MQAPSYILQIWDRFSAFSMETLTKAWCFERCAEPESRQRSEPGGTHA
ncbi:hypothetical protein Q5741_13670 [Paenibacillus sp. JX-17]|uniref:Uncharacterized protein n=1 Tax=Paenibacillus lacisoli TaxID=3064525 RepID=A0ABT9CDW0_9BACL|nr:hypothetical protein [Paenibacillus sp. JX-17]MDO7907455.1 hypothetical protein [Paenibacillus sp. JX-17]